MSEGAIQKEELTFWQKFAKVQYEISVSKDKTGNAGVQYKYRDKEGIILAVKETLNKYGLIVYTDNEICEIGGRIFVQTKATVTDGKDAITSRGWALMEDARIQGSKLTGSAITYSERYALASLLLVCDHTPNIEDFDNLNKNYTESGHKNIEKSSEQKQIHNGQDKQSVQTLDTMTVQYEKEILLPLYEKHMILGKQLNSYEKKQLYSYYKKYIPKEKQIQENVTAQVLFQELQCVFEFDE